MPRHDNGTLQIVASNAGPAPRLSLARRHIETAIAHINDVAQGRVPPTTDGDFTAVDELRLIVRALADIREALHASESDGLRDHVLGTPSPL